MTKVALVFLGGGLGSVCRYLIAILFKEQSSFFPTATLIANVLACLALGVFMQLGLAKSWSTGQLLLFTTGFCGGFSTFSTFSLENQNLIQNREWFLLSSYIILSISLGLVAVYLGTKIGQAFK